jgi:hypothetical protein
MVRRRKVHAVQILGLWMSEVFLFHMRSMCVAHVEEFLRCFIAD